MSKLQLGKKVNILDEMDKYFLRFFFLVKPHSSCVDKSVHDGENLKTGQGRDLLSDDMECDVYWIWEHLLKEGKKSMR